MGINYFGQQGGGAIPVGAIVEFPYTIGSAAGAGNVWTSYPSGYIPCDGRTLYKSEYPEVAELIGDSGGLPVNTSGSPYVVGNQITSGYALTWDSQSPKNVRLSEGYTVLPLGASIAFSNDRGTSWNQRVFPVGQPTFKTTGSVFKLGDYFYVGGQAYTDSTGVATGCALQKGQISTGTSTSLTVGTIGAGGAQTTAVLGAKGTTVYLTITSGSDAGKIYKTINGGSTFTFVQNTSAIYSAIDLNSIWYIETTGQFVFQGTVGGVAGIYRINDWESGTTATLVNTNTIAHGMTYDGTHYYFISAGQIYRTTNFVTISAFGNTTPSLTNGQISLGDGKIWVGGNTGYYSNDDGISWLAYISDGGTTELPFGQDITKNLLCTVNTGDDGSNSIYRLILQSSSGLTFDMPNVPAMSGRIALMKMRS